MSWASWPSTGPSWSLSSSNRHKDGTFDNAKAKDMAKRWFKSQRARLDLLEKYHGKIEKALSSVQAGQFLQIENQIGLFIDVTIASEMPVVGKKGK